MSLPNSRVPGEESGEASASRPGDVDRNGSSAGKDDAAQDAAAHAAPAGDASKDDRSGLDRAEELVDQFADRVSSLTSSWGRELLRLTSRARESAQDFWSDVQEFRQSQRRPE
jgi:hypothetical protein